MSITKPGRMEIAIALTYSRLARRLRYRPFIDILQLKGDEMVLDFGSGWGDNTRYISEDLSKGGEVTALDISPEWQAVMKRRLKGRDNIRYVNSDIRTTDLPESFFDAIVVHYVLHDIPRSERSRIVNEMIKRLRPGGIVLLREPTGKNHGMPISEIRALMSENHLQESNVVVTRKDFLARYKK